VDAGSCQAAKADLLGESVEGRRDAFDISDDVFRADRGVRQAESGEPSHDAVVFDVLDQCAGGGVVAQLHHQPDRLVDGRVADRRPLGVEAQPLGGSKPPLAAWQYTSRHTAILNADPPVCTTRSASMVISLSPSTSSTHAAPTRPISASRSPSRTATTQRCHPAARSAKRGEVWSGQASLTGQRPVIGDPAVLGGIV
jgi:hypothetical protein